MIGKKKNRKENEIEIWLVAAYFYCVGTRTLWCLCSKERLVSRGEVVPGRRSGDEGPALTPSPDRACSLLSMKSFSFTLPVADTKSAKASSNITSASSLLSLSTAYGSQGVGGLYFERTLYKPDIFFLTGLVCSDQNRFAYAF